VIVLLELKEDWSLLRPGLRPFDKAALDRLDAELKSSFAPEQLLTPDEVRGDAATLEQAIRSRGWPLLRAVRGRFLFVLHENEVHRKLFLSGNPLLAGRAMFTCAPPGSPDAGVALRNDPLADRSEIAKLVRMGYLVRTRADADLVADPQQRAAALSSGAQIISTDFPPSGPRRSSGYVCSFPDNRTVQVRATP
jgi:hypothetical protein